MQDKPGAASIHAPGIGGVVGEARVKYAKEISTAALRAVEGLILMGYRSSTVQVRE